MSNGPGKGWWPVLGSRDFIEELTKTGPWHPGRALSRKKLARRPTFGQVVAVVEKLKAAPWNTFRDQHKDWGRDRAVYLGRRRCGLTLRQLAKAINGASAGAAAWRGGVSADAWKPIGGCGRWQKRPNLICRMFKVDPNPRLFH